MGLKDYFRNKAAEKKPAPKDAEKPEVEVLGSLPLPPQLGGLSGHTSGVISSNSSGFIDDIKHEVMVNYLFQQQTAMMWGNPADRSSYFGAGAVAGSEEGVLLRKSRGHYLACPQELARGQFADACTALNVQVGFCALSERGVELTWAHRLR
jgi:hypothetical protein